MDPKSDVIRVVSAAVVEATRHHLGSEGGLRTITLREGEHDINEAPLRELTAIATLSGPISVTVAFSFEADLLRHIFEQETAGLNLKDEECRAFMLDTAAETINTILGLSMRTFAARNRPIDLSAPIVIEQGQRLRRSRDAIFARSVLETERGNLEIFFFMPHQVISK